MLNLFINRIKKSKQARSYLAIFISIFMFLSCANSGDPDQTDFDKVVNNFLISIVAEAIFANPSCGPGLIQIDTEAVPTGTLINVDFVDALFNNVNVCIFDTSTSIDSNGQAFVGFITDYVMGENATGQFRILLTANTPEGQEFTQFTDVTVRGIAIVPPTEDGSTTFNIEIPDMGLPPELLLIWNTLGIKEGTSMSFTVSDGALGSLSPNPATVGADGSAAVVYTPAAAEGIQTIVASITLVTPANVLAMCPVVAPSKTITATIRIIQTMSGMAPMVESDCNNGIDDDMDGPIDCADMDPGDCNPAGGPTVAPCEDGAEATCDDMIDNDGDGDVDCADVADCPMGTMCGGGMMCDGAGMCMP